jgi:hypothetical protein
MEVRSQMDQGCRLCIEPRKMYSCGHWITSQEGKADALDAAEGSSPECAMASIQDTTGVLDQGMDSKG